MFTSVFTKNLVEMDGEGSTLKDLAQQKHAIIDRDRTIEKLEVKQKWPRGAMGAKRANSCIGWTDTHGGGSL